MGTKGITDSKELRSRSRSERRIMMPGTVQNSHSNRSVAARRGLNPHMRWLFARAKVPMPPSPPPSTSPPPPPPGSDDFLRRHSTDDALLAELRLMRRDMRIRHYPLDLRRFGGPDPATAAWDSRKKFQGLRQGGKYYGEEALRQRMLQQSRGELHASTNGESGPCDAHLYLLMFSCTSLIKRSRAENERIETLDAGKVRSWMTRYLEVVRTQFACFNRSAGADHVFACAHDVGRKVLDGVAGTEQMLFVGYSADLSQQNYVHHRDVSQPLFAMDTLEDTPLEKLPWLHPATPRAGPLSFFAGKVEKDGHTRAAFSRLGWARPANATLPLDRTAPSGGMLILDGKLSSAAYNSHMRGAKFCLAPRGHVVWSPRIGEAIDAGCVPVVLANHYAMPLQGVAGIDWRDFALFHDDVPRPRVQTARPGHRRPAPGPWLAGHGQASPFVGCCVLVSLVRRPEQRPCVCIAVTARSGLAARKTRGRGTQLQCIRGSAARSAARAEALCLPQSRRRARHRRRIRDATLRVVGARAAPGAARCRSEMMVGWLIKQGCRRGQVVK